MRRTGAKARTGAKVEPRRAHPARRKASSANTLLGAPRSYCRAIASWNRSFAPDQVVDVPGRRVEIDPHPFGRPAERIPARGAKADIIEQDVEHVGGASRRAQRTDRRKPRSRILHVVGRQTGWFAVRNWQHFTWDVIVASIVSL